MLAFAFRHFVVVYVLLYYCVAKGMLLASLSLQVMLFFLLQWFGDARLPEYVAMKCVVTIHSPNH